MAAGPTLQKMQQPFSSRRCDFGAPLMDDLTLQTPLLKIAAMFRDHTDRSMSRHMLGYLKRVWTLLRRIFEHKFAPFDSSLHLQF